VTASNVGQIVRCNRIIESSGGGNRRAPALTPHRGPGLSERGRPCLAVEVRFVSAGHAMRSDGSRKAVRHRRGGGRPSIRLGWVDQHRQQGRAGQASRTSGFPGQMVTVIAERRGAGRSPVSPPGQNARSGLIINSRIQPHSQAASGKKSRGMTPADCPI
jgi:hypothetical protein